jgi:hypothetical protein
MTSVTPALTPGEKLMIAKIESFTAHIDETLITFRENVQKDNQALENRLKLHFENTISKALSAVEGKVETVSTRVSDLEQKLEALTIQVSENVKSIVDHDTSMDEIQHAAIPALKVETTYRNNALAIKCIEEQMHKRKWSIIVSGVPGEQREHESRTRESMITFAHRDLQIEQANQTNFAACHRLKNTANAPVLVTFLDLAQKDTWLRKAHLLRNAPTKMAITQDLPPSLRELRNEVYERKKSLPELQQRQYTIRYHLAWPFVEMKTPNGDTLKPKSTKAELVSKFLAMENL